MRIVVWAVLATASIALASVRAAAQVVAEVGVGAPALAALPLNAYAIRADPRVRAFTRAYAALIDSVVYLDDDAVFFMGSHPIRFQDGRMVSASRGDEVSGFEPIFYRYSLQPLEAPPPPTGEPTYSTDLLASLFGRAEWRIRQHCESATFLDHKVFVNTLLVEPLQEVEADIRDAAARDPEVADWIDDLDVVYSFMNRSIAGTASRSYHAWGMAVDLRPTSFERKPVYWRWSRALNRKGWSTIPMSRRWSPPEAVIEAFERHGFVWGGKWYHFDAMHFEYRPEILLYNRMLAEGPE